jgi:RNA polymerase sigma factor (sigma-70 family)
MQPLPVDPSAQEIARHTAWMRRLSRALVADPSTADDVVQDAWAKLAGRRSPLGAGYLAAVVRSLAWSRHRGEARRRRREAEVARPEALPSADEVGERVEIARRVAEALAELAEPYRRTLVLRYYDDLSSAEIARREGIPAATVRSRLKRGLEELRSRLDERPGGREAWVGALLPFTRTEIGVSGALVASLSGLVAMKIALAGLCAVLCVALAWRFVARDGEAAGEAAAIAPAARAGAGAATDGSRAEAGGEGSARTAADEPETSEGSGDQSASADVPSFQVLARVLDDHGRPISGAWLAPLLSTQRSAPSGDDGMLAFELDAMQMDRLASLDHNRWVVFQVGAAGRRTVSTRARIERDDRALHLGDVQLLRADDAETVGRIEDQALAQAADAARGVGARGVELQRRQGGVVRVPAALLLGQLVGRVAAPQGGARQRVAAQALGQDRQRRAQPDAVRALRQGPAVGLELDHASAGREHAGGAGRECAEEGARLELAEGGLARGREQGAGNRLGPALRARVGDQRLVEVHEGRAELARQLAAHAGLAAAAQADQRRDRAPALSVAGLQGRSRRRRAARRRRASGA